MSARRLQLALLASLFAVLVAAPSASAHPEVCDKSGGETTMSITNTLGSFWMHASPAEDCFTDEQIAGLYDSGAQLPSGDHRVLGQPAPRREPAQERAVRR